MTHRSAFGIAIRDPQPLGLDEMLRSFGAAPLSRTFQRGLKIAVKDGIALFEPRVQARLDLRGRISEAWRDIWDGECQCDETQHSV
jgi:hypothetical protein